MWQMLLEYFDGKLRDILCRELDYNIFSSTSVGFNQDNTIKNLISIINNIRSIS